jgi:hypothetical protein
MSNKRNRTHNKSKLSELSLLQHSDTQILEWAEELNKKLRKHDGLISTSPCLLLSAGCGRFSFKRKKQAYGYQIVAFQKFGREQLQGVAASKTQSDLVISHLCGTRNCCEPSHLILESKDINDQRTRCHWCMSNAKERNGETGVSMFLASGACPHSPQCCSVFLK